MSHVMITTPARNAMEGHDLTDARTILASDADLYPHKQGRSIARRAVAYSVYCPATERYSLVTLDGRWIIPGVEGYKTRGPVTTYAKKNIATVRPDALVILEPVRHNGRFQATQFGRRSGICRRAIGHATRGTGFDCSCGAPLSMDAVYREGWMIVSDGRGTHTVSYALRSEHHRQFGAVPTEVPERANVVVAGAPVKPAVEGAAVADAPGEAAPAVDAPAAAQGRAHGSVEVTVRDVVKGERGRAGEVTLRRLGNVTVTLVGMMPAEIAEWEWATDDLSTIGVDEKAFRLTVRGWKVVHAEAGVVGVLLQGAGSRVHVEWYDEAKGDFFTVGQARLPRHGAAMVINARQHAGQGLPVDVEPEPVKAPQEQRPVWLKNGTVVRYHGSLEELRGGIFRVYECNMFSDCTRASCDGYDLVDARSFLPHAQHVRWSSVTAVEAPAS